MVGGDESLVVLVGLGEERLLLPQGVEGRLQSGLEQPAIGRRTAHWCGRGPCCGPRPRREFADAIEFGLGDDPFVAVVLELGLGPLERGLEVRARLLEGGLGPGEAVTVGLRGCRRGPDSTARRLAASPSCLARSVAPTVRAATFSRWSASCVFVACMSRRNSARRSFCSAVSASSWARVRRVVRSSFVEVLKSAVVRLRSSRVWLSRSSVRTRLLEAAGEGCLEGLGGGDLVGVGGGGGPEGGGRGCGPAPGVWSRSMVVALSLSSVSLRASLKASTSRWMASARTLTFA